MTTPLDRDLAERLERLAAAVPVRPGQVDRVHASAVSARRQLRLRWMTPLVVLVVLALLGGVLGVGPFTSLLNGPISATTKVGDFELTIRSAKATYRNREPVVLTATLTYRGPKPSVHISHAKSPMTFGIVEPVRGLLLNGIWLMSCGGSELVRGVGLEKPFVKAFGSPVPIPLDAEAFAREPKLMLPPGTWHPYVIAEFALGGCGSPKISMRTEIAIDVLDGPAWSDGVAPTPRPSPTPIPDDVAIHVVNLDPMAVEVVFRNRVVALLSCGESAVISVTDLESSQPWHFIIRTVADETIDAATLDWHLPAGILIRDGAALAGPWPMSYGPAMDACSADTAPSPSPAPTPTPASTLDESQTSTDTDGDFELTLTSDKQVYRPDEPIHIEARLRYRGPSGSVLIGYDSLVSMSIAEKVFGKIQLSDLSLLMCATSTLVRDKPEIVPFRKGGGYHSGSLTDAEMAWFNDPILTLPVGTWHVSASASSPCLGQGAPYELAGALTIIVRE
jgi:hypothetical protein